MNEKISLKEAVKFHGHLGPFLVLGLLMGKIAIKILKCKKHFSIKAIVKGAASKPKSCLIDGIQLSTGCTYGKGNISKLKGKRIQASFYNLRNNKKIILEFKDSLIQQLEKAKNHRDSELLAKKLYKTEPQEVFKLTTNN